MSALSIAILGVGCRLAGATSRDELTALARAPARAFAEVPADRWDARAFGQSPHGGWLASYDLDFRAFRMPPAAVESLHRMERAAMASMQAALLDAGLTPGAMAESERTQIHVAASTLGQDPRNDHTARIRMGEITGALDDALAAVGGRTHRAREVIVHALDAAAPAISVDSMMTTAAMAAGRVANAFDLGGGQLSYDAGASSSLAAISGAAYALASGECDLAIVCGISPILSTTPILAHERRGLTRRGLASIALIGCEPEGTVLSEGAVTLVFARLEDARAHGRNVHAVVRGLGVSSAGRRSMGKATLEGTARAARLALTAARIDAASIDYVECQCAGLPSIDPVELDAIALGYASLGRRAALPVASVAPQVGWLGAASGMASVAAAAMAIATGARGSAADPAKLSRSGGVSLEVGPIARARRVAVSAPGLGQVIHHLILAHPDEPVAARSERRRDADAVSIVGLGARVPGAHDVGALFRGLAGGRTAVAPLTERRFRFQDFDPVTEHGEAPRIALAATVALPVADSTRLRVPPSAMPWLDGAIVLAFDVCEEALEAAGWRPGAVDPDRVGVWVGHLPIRASELASERAALVARSVATAYRALAGAGIDDAPLLEKFASVLGANVLPVTEDTLDTLSSLSCAAKVAARYDARGPIVAIDAACASSLVAVHLACGALLRHEVDLAVVAGVAFNLFPEYYAALATLGALSFRGSRPFEADADGMVPGEGAAAVVLKRRSDAERDRDRAHCVILGAAIASDGRGTAVLAPNANGQERALRRAYHAARVPPTSVDVVEAHGTGTAAGDAVELSALARVLDEVGDTGARRAPAWVGSVKANVGHLSSAAGMIGLVKTALSLERRFVFPTLHSGRLDDAHPALALGRLRLPLVGETWRAPEGGGPRRAGVSSFGLGGIDAHVVLEEAAPPRDRRRASSQTMVAVRPGATRVAARLVPELVPVSLPDASTGVRAAPREGDTVLVLTDPEGAVADELFPRLMELGTHPVLLDASTLEPHELETRIRALAATHGDVGTVIDLTALDGTVERRDASRRRGTFDVERQVIEATQVTLRSYAITRALWVVMNAAREDGREFTWLAATANGGGLGLLPSSGSGAGGALGGFLKSLKLDLPWVVPRVVDLDPTEDADWIAATLLLELAAGVDRVESGWLARCRLVPVLRLAAHGQSKRTALDRATVIFTGGTRGVVLECARALARRRIPVVITGRTEPAGGDEAWAGVTDEELDAMHAKTLLARRGDPAAIREALAEHAERRRRRALRVVLDDARTRREPLEHRVLDVLDATALERLVTEVRGRPGGLLGVVHGAMTLESRALDRATDESIAATLRTKLRGLAHVLGAIGDAPPRFVVAFGSIAGRLGNRSQEDYAAANAAMAQILGRWGDDHPACRVATLEWTAWREVGAAADPSIAALLAASGVEAISPEEGTAWFLDELEQGGREPVAVIASERHVRAWASGGAVDAAAVGGPRFDDRGQPIDPGAFPLVDVIFGSAADVERVVERELSPAADALLCDHHVRGSAVLPGTFALELLAEAALAAHGRGSAVVAMSDFKVEAPLRFPGDVAQTVRVHARRDGSSVLCRASVALALPSSLPQDRAYATARATLGAALSDARGAAALVPIAPPKAFEGSYFARLLAPMRLGPRFHRVAWVLPAERSIEGIVLGTTPEDLMARTTTPDFVMDPVVLDAALQIAGNWDALRPGGWISVPVAIARVELHARRTAGAPVRVRATVREEREGDEPEVVYDLTLESLSGELLTSVTGLVLRRIEPTPEPAS